MAAAGFLLLLASVPLWLLRIRPYARRHGAGRTAGTDFGVAAWTDCQQAREIAEKRGDSGTVMACRTFVSLAGGGLALMLIGAFF